MRTIIHVSAHIMCQAYLVGFFGLNCGLGTAVEWTPLHYAAHYDKPNLAKALIRHQADLDKRTAGWI
jgi:hypothetical protein